MKCRCLIVKRKWRKFLIFTCAFCIVSLTLLRYSHNITNSPLKSTEKHEKFHEHANFHIHETFLDKKPLRMFEIPKEWFHDNINNSRNVSVSNNTTILFSSEFILKEKPIIHWLAKSVPYCDRKFVGYDNLFAELSNVTLDPSKNYNHKGGEEIEEVKEQPENAEYLTLDKGYFVLPCQNCEKLNFTFSRRDQPNSQWLKYIKCHQSSNNIKVVNNFVIAVQRYEYVNVYHTMTDWYNSFLMTLVFKQNPKQTSILWMDAHPKGSLDSVWRTLFGSTLQASRVEQPLIFRKLVWSINGYDSFMNQHSLDRIPYIEEFRTFFLNQFNISTNVAKNCKSLNILFLLRHDYVAHPRNMKGIIQRKIANEEELITRVLETFPGHKVSGVQLDSFPFRKQLEIISNTDILIGMHGAGMTMSVFLPKHAGVIELYPAYFSTNNVHFRSIAKWRRLKYHQWQNQHQSNEHEHYNTYITPSVVVDFVTKTKNQICGAA